MVGGKIPFLLNHRYVFGRFCRIWTARKPEFKMNSGDAPCLLTKGNEDYLYIVMPIRRWVCHPDRALRRVEGSLHCGSVAECVCHSSEAGISLHTSVVSQISGSAFAGMTIERFFVIWRQSHCARDSSTSFPPARNDKEVKNPRCIRILFYFNNFHSYFSSPLIILTLILSVGIGFPS